MLYDEEEMFYIQLQKEKRARRRQRQVDQREEHSHRFSQRNSVDEGLTELENYRRYGYSDEYECYA